MKTIILTVLMAILPLSLCAQKAEKIFDEASMHYNNQNYDKAIPLFEKCLDKEYFVDGNVYVWLYEAYNALGNVDKGSTYIYEGIKMFPDNIYLNTCAANICMESNDNSSAVNYLNKAILLEPDNASLYYIKGNALMALGEVDKALHTYKQCSDVDENYEFGDIAIGLYYYDLAAKLQESEATDFEQFIMKIEEPLLDAITSFEKAFNKSADLGIKLSLAEHLYNAYGVLVYYYQDSVDYKEKYEYYTNYFDNGGQQ